MDIEKSFLLRAEGSVRRVSSWAEPAPQQIGLAAALRRAFDLPADENERQFEQLLRQLG